MRPTLIAVILCLAVVGCSNNQGKIEGTKWVNATARNWPANTITLEFKANGEFVMTIADRTVNGKYSLGSGDQLTVSFDQPRPGQKGPGDPFKIDQSIKISGDEMKWTDWEGKPMNFKKAG